MQYTLLNLGDSGRKKSLVAMALLMAAMLVTGFVWAPKTVYVAADGGTRTIRTVHSTPEAVLEQAGIVLGTKDEYRLTTQKVTNNTTIEVYRSVPVTVVQQGNVQIEFTAKPTVAELAQSLGHAPGQCLTNPTPETRIQPGMEISIKTLTEATIQKEVADPHPIIRQPDPLLEKGVEQKVEAGADGKKQLTVVVRYADGEKLDETVVAEQVLSLPQAEVRKVGTRETVETSRGDLRFRSTQMMEATAYLPTDGDGRGITASGIRARYGVVAVDPRVIPLGTRLYIPGYGLAIAADTGGAIKGNKIDLCMEDAGAAWRFGRRMMKVYILCD